MPISNLNPLLVPLGSGASLFDCVQNLYVVENSQFLQFNRIEAQFGQQTKLSPKIGYFLKGGESPTSTQIKFLLPFPG